MPRTGLIAACAFVVWALPLPAHAVTFEMYKAALALEVQVPGPAPDTIAKRKLNNNDIINLALGRPLTTKVEKKNEILALAADATTPSTQSQVVVFNPTTKTITTPLWTFSNFRLLHNDDFSLSYVVTDANFVATTLGTPAQDGFLASVITIAGSGKHSDSGALSSGTTAIAGPVTFRAAGGLVDGLIVKGKFKTSGAFLAVIP